MFMFTLTRHRARLFVTVLKRFRWPMYGTRRCLLSLSKRFKSDQPRYLRRQRWAPLELYYSSFSAPLLLCSYDIPPHFEHQSINMPPTKRADGRPMKKARQTLRQVTKQSDNVPLVSPSFAGLGSALPSPVSAPPASAFTFKAPQQLVTASQSAPQAVASTFTAPQQASIARQAASVPAAHHVVFPLA